MKDTYGAHWFSHSSIGDYLRCPRSYYLRNIYKNPKTKNKINIASPALSLGSAVHEALEGLAKIKSEERFQTPLTDEFENAWKKVSGKRGGFASKEEEDQAKERGMTMIRRAEKNPGPLAQKIVKLKLLEKNMLPYFFLSRPEKIILCGKIDWLMHVPEDDSIHILDFKTGKNEENEDSLQLPIYQLLSKNLQKRKVSGASYWYIDRDDKPTPVTLPDENESYEKVLNIAREIKNARELSLKEGPEKVFICPRGPKGCFACRSLEKILLGHAEFVGVDEEMRKDIYIDLGK